MKKQHLRCIFHLRLDFDKFLIKEATAATGINDFVTK
jgi:hypothetical protein